MDSNKFFTLFFQIKGAIFEEKASNDLEKQINDRVAKSVSFRQFIREIDSFQCLGYVEPYVDGYEGFRRHVSGQKYNKDHLNQLVKHYRSEWMDYIENVNYENLLGYFSEETKN